MYSVTFFSSAFSQEEFDRVLSNEGAAETNTKRNFLDRLTGSYLGNITVRPLPRTMIGRTVLKTYSDQFLSTSNGNRRFPSTIACECNLFGIPLSVDSLPYQEQDGSVSACATIALWSVLHKTAKLFGHPMFSPGEITKLAMQGTMFTGQVFPNNGLTGSQICHAIRAVGLESKCFDFTNRVTHENHLLEFKESVYSYLEAGIPMIFGFDLYRRLKNATTNDLWKLFGRHAVAITGYGLQYNPYQYDNNKSIRIVAHRIKKIFVHDDQTGPFSKMEFADGFDKDIISIRRGEKTQLALSLSTTWHDVKHGYDYRAVPIMLIAPLYHKIRIDYSIIRGIASVINSRFYEYFSINFGTNGVKYWNQNISWNIVLTCLNEYKENMFVQEDLSSNERIRILTAPLPRFFWRCSLESGGRKAIDFLFDATDVSSGDLFVHSVVYRNDFSSRILAVIKPVLLAACQHPSLRVQCILRLILQDIYRGRVTSNAD